MNRYGSASTMMITANTVMHVRTIAVYDYRSVREE